MTRLRGGPIAVSVALVVAVMLVVASTAGPATAGIVLAAWLLAAAAVASLWTRGARSSGPPAEGCDPAAGPDE